jgi:hypothetical protein
VRLATLLHLVPRLKMSGTVPQLNFYASMACIGKFYLFFFHLLVSPHSLKFIRMLHAVCGAESAW